MDATNLDIEKSLADPESIGYAAMLSDIDAIAVQLRKLQDVKYFAIMHDIVHMSQTRGKIPT